MNQFTGTSLKTRLYLLVLAAFIPVTLLIFYVAEEQKGIETEAILHKTRLLAQASADAENLQVASTRSLLAAMAEAFRLLDDQPDRRSRFFTEIAGQTRGFEVFGILDPAGRLIAGSDPSSMASDYGDQTWLADCLKHKRLAMGTYHGEHIRGEPVLYIAGPVPGPDGEVTAVVFTALNLNWMNRNILKQLSELPKGSRLTLQDESHGMLRYDVDTAQWTTPRSFSAAVQQAIGSRPAGTLIADDDSGQPWIYAFASLESAFRQRHVSVVLEIPEVVAMAASKRIFIRNLSLLAVTAILAVLAIWWAANTFILKRVGAMVRTSRRLAAGDLQARIGSIGAYDELSHLAGVFDEMAGSLQMRIEREEQAMTSLKHSREQLRRLSAYQTDVREQERIRIAREIHDQLGQSLTILKMDLAWMTKRLPASNEVLAEKMTTMSQVIEEAMEKLHAVTTELRPVILDDFGLAAAIEWQAEAFTRHSGIGCRLENNGYEPELPKAQATALFRIFQETLTNILRHADADDVVVRLKKQNSDLFFQVADNGKGITEEDINAPDAFGLLGIRERLYPFNGRVSFEGRPGQGTRVTIHLPLPPEGEIQ